MTKIDVDRFRRFGDEAIRLGQFIMSFIGCFYLKLIIFLIDGFKKYLYNPDNLTLTTDKCDILGGLHPNLHFLFLEVIRRGVNHFIYIKS